MLPRLWPFDEWVWFCVERCDEDDAAPPVVAAAVPVLAVEVGPLGREESEEDSLVELLPMLIVFKK